MNILKNIGAATVAALCFTLSSPVKADLTIVEKTSVDFSKAKLMGKPFPASSAKATMSVLNGMGDTTMYFSGKKIKTSNVMMTTITDNDAKKSYMLNPTAKTYATIDLSTPTAIANTVQKSITGAAGASTAQATEALLKGMKTYTRDLKQTKTILGYKAHLVKTTVVTQGMSMTMYMWLTDDLKEAEAASKSSSATKYAGADVHGFPLKMTMEMSMGQLMSGMSTSTTVDSISKDPIPASTFEIPTDYKEVASDKLNLTVPGISIPGLGAAIPGAAPTTPAPAPLTQPDAASPAPNAK